MACRGSRALTKADLLHNDYLPEITIEPDTYRVIVDGHVYQHADDHRAAGTALHTEIAEGRR